MTDKEKLEKLVAYLIRRMYAHNQMADIGSTGEIFDEKIENAKYEECKDTLNFIDSMQEEPKKCMYSKDNYTDEDRKVLCDGCEEERCKYSKLNTMLDVALSKETKESWNKRLKEETKESVSEDLDFIATRNALAYVNNINRGESPWLDSDMELAYEDGMKAGANWQKQQMIKKAIKAEYWDNSLMLDAEMRGKYEDGDKIKIIIIKDE